MATTPFPPLPLELLERIVHFAIRARSLKRALRLRLVNRQFRQLVNRDMSRTRLLDECVFALAQELSDSEFDSGDLVNPNSPRGVDTPWFSFLKRYLVDRLLAQPVLDSRYPESVIHHAAARLRRLLGDEASEDAMGRHVAALCQVFFWERYCCMPYHATYASKAFVFSLPTANSRFDGDGLLKKILLNAAIYVGDVDLTQRLFDMEPNTDSISSEDCYDDRNTLATAHGGLATFRLVNAVDLGLETEDEYRREFTPSGLMGDISHAAARGADADLINRLLDLGEPWDGSDVSYWTGFSLRRALLHAPSPEIFERLAPIAGPSFTPVEPYHLNGPVCVRATPPAGRLAHHAAAVNPAMIRYLLDRGCDKFVNNPGPESLPPAGRGLGADGLKNWVKDRRESRAWEQSQHRPLLRAAESGSLEVAAVLLARGADPNAHAVGDTPLSAAVRHGDLAMARLLLFGRGGGGGGGGGGSERWQARADPNAGTPPPIALAVAAEDDAMIELLLRAGAVADTPETGGWAMAVAEREGLESMVDMLVGLGVERGAVWHHVPSLHEFILGERFFGDKRTAADLSLA